MNRFELERVWMVGLVATIVFCVFGLLMGLLARRKGYSFLAWFGSGGTLLISVIVLAFLPKNRGQELSAETLSHQALRGDRLGWILTLVNYWIAILATTFPALANFGENDPHTLLQKFVVPAFEWGDWAYLVGIGILLLRFAWMPRNSRNPLTIAVFILITLQIVWARLNGWLEKEVELSEGWQKAELITKILSSGIGAFVTLALCFLATDSHRHQPSQD